jgi:hypothetical protein
MVFGERVSAVVLRTATDASQFSYRVESIHNPLQSLNLGDRPVHPICGFLELCDVCGPHANRRRLKAPELSCDIRRRHSHPP